MLTIKQITENKEAVVRGLEKKHFADAAAAIDRVLEYNDMRKKAQAELDQTLSEQKVLAKSIGQLMKEGRRDEAEKAKEQVATLKSNSPPCCSPFPTCPTTSCPKAPQPKTTSS